jgi:uncharacterized GH25 family protein
MRHLFGMCCLFVAASAAVSAHDFWLGAADWRPGPGAQATITAGIGEHFPTRTQTRMTESAFEEWRMLGAAGTVPVANDFVKAGLEFTTKVSLPAPGAYLGVAVISAQTIEMKGDEFTDYLKEEGLDAIVAARQAAGESASTTTERFGRYAKIALRTGSGPGAHITRPARLKVELVPAVDPTSLRAGQPLTVQFLSGGTPVANATVMAVSGGVAARAQTNADGRATFTIDRPGPWLIKTIHMVRLPAGSPTVWESSWATLTFHTAA